ncbi:hypothetical protein CJ030_MR5G001028 [Morella rubra]|uniref:Transmembrane protein n=1 Tax=Morella rubra TaxID=262757 RepID=A0A6A1VIA4_9ROSI|nr:hypothetical protein CJ030_MR5G001028 [Morella rubra]
MVRQPKEALISYGGVDDTGTHACLVFWIALVTGLALISIIIFSCADGGSRDKDSTADGAQCAAGCGAECGA